jgi:hypothetical protein
MTDTSELRTEAREELGTHADCEHGPRPEQLRLTVVAFLAVGSLLIVLGVLIGTGAI